MADELRDPPIIDPPIRLAVCVSGEGTTLQNLIDRLRRGDDSARRELLQRAHDRLLRIAATLFNEDFPGLRGRHDRGGHRGGYLGRRSTATGRCLFSGR